MSAASATQTRRWVRTSEAARLLGAGEQTVRRNAATGINIRVRNTPGISPLGYPLDSTVAYAGLLLRESDADWATPIEFPGRLCGRYRIVSTPARGTSGRARSETRHPRRTSM